MATPKRTRRTDGSVPCNCLVCNKRFVNRKSLVDHIEKIHASQIPDGWSASRYENYLRTGKTEGKCVICGKSTPWNPVTEKYGRMCGSDACRKTARDRAKNNYIDKHGKEYTLNDPEQQRKMVYARKNAGKYIFEDETTGKKYEALYDSGYGREFFEMIDTLLFWPGDDIMAPSPHTYYYEYEGEKHFYIPDAYIYSLNLEVELKDGGKNPNTHPKILAVDKVKERLKDEVMESLKGQVNYIKICDKNYAEFFAMLAKLRGQDISLPKWEAKLSHITEAYLPSESNYGEIFNSYYLDERKYDHPGGWDEEHFSKTLDDEIKHVISNSTKEEKGDKIFYVYTMGANFFRTYRAVLLGAIHVYWYSKWKPGQPPKYDYEWDYQEEVRAEDCYDFGENVVYEGSDLATPKLNLIRRNELLTNPVLNYDALLEDYRKRLFHKRLNKKEWDALYNELLKVRDNLKVVINGNSENDKRLNYEAKKALVEVNRFIEYMEDQSVVKESVIVETKQYAKKLSKKDIVRELDTFAKKYPTTEWMVGFKGALVLYGLVNECNDIDIFATDDICNDLIDAGCHTEPAPHGGVRITVTKRLEVFPANANNQVIGNTVIDGFRVDDIENIKSFYKRMNHPKDRETIARIEAYQSNGGVLESTDIFTSGCFSDYVKYANLDNARGEIPTYKKGTKTLADFQRMPLTDDIVVQYRDKCPDLKYGRYASSGCIWVNQFDDSVVGYVRTQKHEWMTWLNGIKVEELYRGYGLGDQMMDIAQNEFNAHYLTVNNKNTAAISLFRKHGFGVYDGTEWCSHMTDLQKPFMEEPTLESSSVMEGVVSHINPNYTGKETFRLTDYRRVPIGNDVLKKYKGRYPMLKHIREDDGGVIWFDGDNVVAVVGAAPHRDTTDPSEIWIHSFEISKEYRNHGLARQILDVAIKELNAQYLSVAKKNEVALELYKKVGFVTYGENKDMWFMKLRGAKTPKFADRPIREAASVSEHDPVRKTFGDDEIVISNPGLDKHFMDLHQHVIPYSITENALPVTTIGTELSDIIAFNKKTNNMEYILPNGGNIITRISEEDYYKYYRLLSPEDFEKYNGGVCWDYVLYEAKYFDKYFPDVKYKTFYFCSEKGNSHTFLIFELDNVYYWYESSWKAQVGLYGFRSEKDAVDYVTNLLLTDLITRENNGVPMRGYVFEYDVDEIAIGTRCWNYMKHMIRKLDQLGDRKCLVKKRQVRPIRVMRGKVVYESAVGLPPAFQREPLMEAFKDNDNDVSFGKSETDILSIIKTMTPTEQIYLGTPGGRRYNWSRSEFYQEVLYVGQTPVAFLVVSEIPSNKGVGHIIIGVRAGNQYRHKGYASMLINRFITSDKIPSHITSLEWGFDDGNVKSERLAAKFGFSNPTVPEDQVHHRGYIMTQSVDAMKNVVRESVIDDRYHLIDMPGIQLQTALPYTSSVRELVHKSTMREENWYNTLESTYIETTRDGQPYFPVFIFLSYTGTKMAQIIKSFTHDPYAHSSISFDTTLEHMISFNRDGMVEENIAKGIWKTKAKQIKYSLYMYMASAQEYDAMKQFIDELLSKKSKLKYNLLGLTNFIFGRGSEREDKFFCSEFVASVISAGNNTLIKKSPHMTTPYNLAKNKNFIFIKKGILSHYDQTVVDKILAEKLEEGGFDNVSIK